MNDTSDKARSMAALQLAQWMFFHLVGKSVISRAETKRILERAIELNIRGNQLNAVLDPNRLFWMTHVTVGR
jgi:hypothetical protein